MYKESVTTVNQVDGRVRRAIDLFERGAFPANVSLAVIARSVGLSRSWFSVMFSKNVGVSPFEALRTAILRHAEALLVGDDGTSIKEIALCLGYSSPGRFSRAFRARYGLTPTEYRAGAGIEL